MKRLLSRLALAALVLVTAGASTACLVPVAAGIAVTLGPPPLRADLVIAAPGPQLVWVPGYWDWHGAAWVWVPGAWLRPPHPHAAWVRPVYHQRRGHWYYSPGHWH